MQKIEIEKVAGKWIVLDVGRGEVWRCPTLDQALSYARRFAEGFDKPKPTVIESMLVEALETIKRTSTNGIVIQISLEALADAKKMRGE